MHDGCDYILRAAALANDERDRSVFADDDDDSDGATVGAASNCDDDVLRALSRDADADECSDDDDASFDIVRMRDVDDDDDSAAAAAVDDEAAAGAGFTATYRA